MKLKIKILVVDDEKLTLDFFDLMLSKLGFEVLKAEDGFEALEMIKKNNPDIVLLDNLLPKLTGFEVTQIIKKDENFKEYKNLPIIMFSAMDSTDDKILGLEMGIEDYITKPFNFSEVLARIRNVIRHNEIVKQLIKREKRLAITDTLINSVIAFARHIKRPFTDLYRKINKLDCSNKEEVVKFIENFKKDYEEMMALQQTLEDEIRKIDNEKNKLKEEEISLEEIEKRIAEYLKKKEDDK